MINSMTPSERLIVALDFSSRAEILRAVDQLHGLAGVFKLGLQAFTANGPSIVSELVRRGEKVFLDLKLHDIPSTVERAVAAAADLGVLLLTIHTAGGTRMMSEAVRVKRNVRLLGVTVLTSLDDEALAQVGYSGEVEANVIRLAKLAQVCGLDGVIASPLEIASVRRFCGDGFLIVTPGIRGPGDSADDQRRTMPASAAIRAGADYIVVGRPITAAPDPRAAAKQILEAMSDAGRGDAGTRRHGDAS